ncbi:MAG TPA: C39 family peptidase [Nitrococcus sp.]|nr:C39 family peptidase [Nitrococcus sp.]
MDEKGHIHPVTDWRASNWAMRLALCLIGSLLMTVPAAQAANVHIPGFSGGFSMFAKSLKQARWDTTVHQQYDYSCGSAAVATLLTYHYNMPTPETAVFQAMFRAGDQQKIRTQGFSMLDMKRYLDSRGLHSDGFRMTLNALEKIGVPGITLVNTKGYRHFVVIKGVTATEVVVGDPAAGTTVVPRKLFEQIWNGEVLAARARIITARAHFNTIKDWSVRPQAPLTRGVDRTGLGLFTLTLPGLHEFGGSR